MFSLMNFNNYAPAFPTTLHQEAAKIVHDYFYAIPIVDTVLLVNSCARGKAVPESDLDFAILVKPDTASVQTNILEEEWRTFSKNESTIVKYTESRPFAQLHLDVIDGRYRPGILEPGGLCDNFEIEIGNQVVHSAPLKIAGNYFNELQQKWAPYYNERLRLQRLAMVRNACYYDLGHISSFVKRELYFHAFDTLYKAFQKYLQALFIANKTYPIAYNKWIKEQVAEWLNKPELYLRLSNILSLSNIESDECIHKARILRSLLDELT